ncbi:MAG: penicillin-binding protein, partial [Acidimicrobiia bacterium]|nr:penicillin-binding protein [Acidimicrobiia bacterium]
MEFHQAERQDRRGRRLVSVVVLVGATILVSSWAGLFGFLGANAAVGTIEGLKSEYIPEVDLLELHLPSVSQLSEVYTEDGIRLGFLTERNSQPVPLSDIPDTVINAVLAAEDSGFFDHEGIDFRAIARAGVEQTRGGSIQGGSTITQQVVKQNFGTTERTIERKIREAVVAAELERRYTKEQILEYYVNSVFFGANAYGVKAASQEYFGKELSDITVAEAAAIVTAIRNPTLYDMRDEPERVKRARDDVIANMVNEGFITAAEGERAQAEPLAPIAHKDFQELAPQVIIEVREQLLNDPRFNTGNTFTERKQALFGCAAQDKACEASTSLKGGLTVVTTLDFALQEEANRILRDWFPAAEGGTTPTGAIAMVDNSNGAVRVMASGLDF